MNSLKSELQDLNLNNAHQVSVVQISTLRNIFVVNMRTCSVNRILGAFVQVSGTIKRYFCSLCFQSALMYLGRQQQTALT